jgi:hypothetical protein
MVTTRVSFQGIETSLKVFFTLEESESTSNDKTYLAFDQEVDYQNSGVYFNECRRAKLNFHLEFEPALPNTYPLYFYLDRVDHKTKWNDNLAIKIKYDRNTGYWRTDKNDSIKVAGLLCGEEAFITLCEAKSRPILFLKDADWLPATTRIKPYLKPEVKAVYDYIKNDVEMRNQSNDVTLPCFDTAKVDLYAKTDSLGTLPSLRYQQIRQIWPQLEHIINEILWQPVSRMMPIPIYCDFDHEIASDYLEKFTGDIIEVFQIEQKLPITFCGFISQQIVDIPENRQVYRHLFAIKSFLDELNIDFSNFIQASEEYSTTVSWGVASSARISASLHKEEQKQLQAIIFSCESFISRFEEIINSRLVDGNIHSETFSYDHRYSNFLLHYGWLCSLLQHTDTSDDDFKFQAAPFTRTYQWWCLFKVIDAMHSLGFIPINEELESILALYSQPKSDCIVAKFCHPEYADIHVEVWHERHFKEATLGTYGFLEADEDLLEDDRSLRKKRNPDITIEFNCPSRFPHPWIITLDPTITTEKKYLGDKFAYMDNIVYFGESNEEYVKIILASWSLSPKFGSTDEKIKPFGSPNSKNYTKGYIALNHQEPEQTIKDALKSIFSWIKLYPFTKD